jgi:phage baseplate assembly protein W
MTTSTFYSDIPTNLTVHPIKEDLVLITNEQAVKRSIRNLLLTDMGERFFNPTLGGNIRASLFENIDQNTEYILKSNIEDTINNYEPRAQLYNVSVVAQPDENAYSVTIVFTLANRNVPLTLDLILRRVR